ncbi:MAG: hypothetical protein E7203_05135 [Selenomonas ruminantium]|uniref:Uncharacterized protein n=1 Tax=Selenomonas ruminantium TaxID=971 RepID=A0A927WDU1_SELRU|nr:hypothetical protein [Selenomonas ruminantium]MBE6084842.1 hypothetical protein [Selenomonas ruminantium]
MDSGNFAEWGWDGTSATSATGNRFIFKYHPTLTFTAKVLPEPDQPKNQYREYEKELTTPTGVAKFMMTYNGSTFDIYPADNTAKKCWWQVMRLKTWMSSRRQSLPPLRKWA